MDLTFGVQRFQRSYEPLLFDFNQLRQV